MSASNLRSFARYLTLLQTASQTAFADAPVGYDRTVWDTWQISIDAATAEAPLAAKLMGILGCLAPKPANSPGSPTSPPTPTSTPPPTTSSKPSNNSTATRSLPPTAPPSTPRGHHVAPSTAVCSGFGGCHVACPHFACASRGARGAVSSRSA